MISEQLNSVWELLKVTAVVILGYITKTELKWHKIIFQRSAAWLHIVNCVYHVPFWHEMYLCHASAVGNAEGNYASSVA